MRAAWYPGGCPLAAPGFVEQAVMAGKAAILGKLGPGVEPGAGPVAEQFQCSAGRRYLPNRPGLRGVVSRLLITIGLPVAGVIVQVGGELECQPGMSGGDQVMVDIPTRNSSVRAGMLPHVALDAERRRGVRDSWFPRSRESFFDPDSESIPPWCACPATPRPDHGTIHSQPHPAARPDRSRNGPPGNGVTVTGQAPFVLVRRDLARFVAGELAGDLLRRSAQENLISTGVGIVGGPGRELIAENSRSRQRGDTSVAGNCRT